MSRLTQLLDAVAAGIATAASMPPESVRVHGGDVTAEETDRWAVKLPAVLVTWLGGTETQDLGGTKLGTYSLNAVIVTKDQIGTGRHAAIAALEPAVRAAVVSNLWGLSFTQAPDRVRSLNRYSSALDERGLALAVVAWEQTIEFEDDPSVTLVPFETLFVEYDLAPTDTVIEASDTHELEQP